MPSPIHIPLEENQFYHIYNRGNDGTDLFYQDRNYIFFLKKYDNYLSEYVDTYAYCLLPNHFHLLVRVKSKSDFVVNKEKFPNGMNYVSDEIHKQGLLYGMYSSAGEMTCARYGKFLSLSIPMWLRVNKSSWLLGLGNARCNKLRRMGSRLPEIRQLLPYGKVWNSYCLV